MTGELLDPDGPADGFTTDDLPPDALLEAWRARTSEVQRHADALNAPVTAETLTPDENGVVMFPPEVVQSIARMDAARARLRELGARHVDLGECEHGWVAGVRLQRGRAHVEVVAHGAPSPAQALEELAIKITALPPEQRRRHRKGRKR